MINNFYFLFFNLEKQSQWSTGSEKDGTQELCLVLRKLSKKKRWEKSRLTVQDDRIFSKWSRRSCIYDHATLGLVDQDLTVWKDCSMVIEEY